MGKDLEVSRLCDAYGSLLTEHRLNVLRDFYDNDLSLAEIAENLGITRQAALCSIKQAEKQLRDYESKMGLVRKTDMLRAELDKLSGELDRNTLAAKSTLDKLIDGLQL